MINSEYFDASIYIMRSVHKMKHVHLRA